MQITITARHFDLTNAIREYIETNADRLYKYFDHIINVHFILSLDSGQSHVEVVLHVPRHDFRTEIKDKDMYTAIDMALDKMEHQIKKLKDKWTDHQKRSLKENTEFVYANLIEKKGDRRRVKIKRIPPETMSVNDAIDIMEENEEFFLIFKDVHTDTLSVLVRKDDMHYKLFATS